MYSRSLIRAFFILQCPNILQVDNDGPDQTAHSRSLIRAFVVLIYAKGPILKLEPIHMYVGLNFLLFNKRYYLGHLV